jgi:hypothetical protein
VGNEKVKVNRLLQESSLVFRAKVNSQIPPCYLAVQASLFLNHQTSTLIIEAACPFEKSVSTNRTIQHHNLETAISTLITMMKTSKHIRYFLIQN